VTPLVQIALLAAAFIGLAFLTASAVREWRRSDREDQAADDWDTAVTDALRLAAIGRHPTSQRRSVAGLWRAMYPRQQTRPGLRLVDGDR
jgi:hypothetical protein